MNGKFQYPNIHGSTEREQLTEIKRFLWQLVDELNHSQSDEKSTGETVMSLTQTDAEQIARKASTQILVTATLKETGWEGTQSPYSQTVKIPGVTASSQVELLPDRQTLNALWKTGCLLTVENTGGTVIVYALGEKPSADITIQTAITKARAKD